jgi:predicted DNA-binding transcriptional regulator AlpA
MESNMHAVADQKDQHAGGEAVAGTAARRSQESFSGTPAPILLTDVEAAAILGVSKRTFLNLRSSPWCPSAIALGPRLLRWSADELRAAVASMPRQTDRVQPQSLLRAKIERMKATGEAEPVDPAAKLRKAGPLSLERYPFANSVGQSK